MKRLGRTVAMAVGVLALCIPLAAAMTLALIFFWDWVARTYWIKATVHSGPANWCFELVYALWVVGIGSAS